ncbi:MAG: hypothetical protein VX463_11365, partial [Pseudomonadota bacterium]|nr:hypothetical protein [Pseudomonadota bacterium]
MPCLLAGTASGLLSGLLALACGADLLTAAAGYVGGGGVAALAPGGARMAWTRLRRLSFETAPGQGAPAA